jgi:hypothetical protein
MAMLDKFDQDVEVTVQPRGVRATGGVVLAR